MLNVERSISDIRGTPFSGMRTHPFAVKYAMELGASRSIITKCYGYVRKIRVKENPCFHLQMVTEVWPVL